jgi:hypothetical protein
MQARRIVVLTAALLAAACGTAPIPLPAPVAASAPSITSAASVSPPVASSAVVAPEAAAICVPKRLRTEAWVADAWIDGASIALCLSASEQVNGCWSVDPATSQFKEIAPRAKPPRWPRLSSGKTHRLDSSAAQVTACKVGTSECHTIKPWGFRFASPEEFSDEIRLHLPSDVSPDGQKLLLVRHEGGRSEKIFGETYDLKSRKRESRFAIKADQHVDRVAWLGKRALVTICVDEGPGCHVVLVNPKDGKASNVPANDHGPMNVFGVESPCHHVRDDLWACVGGAGKTVVFFHADDGKVETELDTGHETSIMAGVEVVLLPAGRLAIISGAPVGGHVIVVDLASRKVTARLLAPVCKEAAGKGGVDDSGN